MLFSYIRDPGKEGEKEWVRNTGKGKQYAFLWYFTHIQEEAHYFKPSLELEKLKEPTWLKHLSTSYSEVVPLLHRNMSLLLFSLPQISAFVLFWVISCCFSVSFIRWEISADGSARQSGPTIRTEVVILNGVLLLLPTKSESYNIMEVSSWDWASHDKINILFIQQIFIESLPCAPYALLKHFRRCFKCFVHDISVNSHNKSVRRILVLLPFYRSGSWGSRGEITCPGHWMGRRCYLGLAPVTEVRGHVTWPHEVQSESLPPITRAPTPSWQTVRRDRTEIQSFSGSVSHLLCGVFQEEHSHAEGAVCVSPWVCAGAPHPPLTCCFPEPGSHSEGNWKPDPNLPTL